jgi:hypothetical protein
VEIWSQLAPDGCVCCWIEEQFDIKVYDWQLGFLKNLGKPVTINQRR